MPGIGESGLFTVDAGEDEGDGAGASESRFHCVGCADLSPPTHSSHTLISSQHGWRLSRRLSTRGEYLYEWRCPKCWRRHKERGVKDG